MTPQELKEIEARANAATPGPWIASFTRCGTGMGYNSYAHQVRIGTHEHTVAHSEVVTGDVVSTRRSQTLVNPTNAKPTLEPDADFIAHARSDIPNLLAHIAALTERLRAVEAERDEVQRERDASYKALLDLTPGGSEFHNDPMACISFVKGRLSSISMAKLVELKKGLERKDAALKDVELAFEEARDCVLNERHELAEQGTTNDSINSVLAILDRTVGAALSRIAALTGEKK